MDKIYHYTSFETFKKIVETGAIRFNSLANVDDAEEGVLLDTISQAAYTYVSCWTKSESESIPMWRMYVDSPFAVRIGVSAKILEPAFTNRPFISNHTNRMAQVFLFHRGSDRKFEFLSDVVYSKQPKLQMYRSMRGLLAHEYIENYGISKSLQWEFQNEVRFILQAVPLSQLRPRKGVPLFKICQEVIINNDPTDICSIDMLYDLNFLLRADLMLGPSTSKEHEQELMQYLTYKLPGFCGKIHRSSAYIRNFAPGI